MKKNLTILLLILSTSSFALNNNLLRDAAEKIQQYDSSGNYKMAALMAASFANKIADEGKFDKIIGSIDLTLFEKRKEVITSSHVTNTKMSFWGVLSATFNKSYDATKILTINPRTVANFKNKNQEKISKLQNKIKEYIKTNEKNLFYAKVFAAKALLYTNKLPINEIPQIYSYVLKSAQRVTMVNFLGVENILHCINTEYASRSNVRELKESAFFYSFTNKEKHVQKSYNENVCDSETVTISSATFTYRLTDLMLADNYIQTESRILSLKMLTERKNEVYPTWGSPYFK